MVNCIRLSLRNLNLMHFYPVSCLWQNVQCPGESLSNKQEVHLEILVMSPVLNVRESFFICYVEFFGLNMRPTWILVLVQSLHLINLQLLRKTDKASLRSGGELLVSALMNNSIQNFHHNYSLINNYLQIAFGSAPFAFQ